MSATNTAQAPQAAETPAPRPAEPYRLIGNFQDHLRFQGRKPRTLAEKLQAQADWDHGYRTAQLKRLADKFALLEPFLPHLAELGTPVHNRTFDLWHTKGGPTLGIQPSVFSGSQGDEKLNDALLHLGFKEVERTSYTACSLDTVVLKHGRSLRVRIHVSTKPAVASTPSIAGAAA